MKSQKHSSVEWPKSENEAQPHPYSLEACSGVCPLSKNSVQVHAHSSTGMARQMRRPHDLRTLGPFAVRNAEPRH